MYQALSYTLCLLVLAAKKSGSLLGLPDGASGKEPAYQCWRQRGVVSIPKLGRSPEGTNGNPLQYSCRENSRTEEPVGCSPQGHRESDTTERLRAHAVDTPESLLRKRQRLSYPPSYPQQGTQCPPQGDAQ